MYVFIFVALLSLLCVISLLTIYSFQCPTLPSDAKVTNYGVELVNDEKGAVFLDSFPLFATFSYF